MLYLYESKLAIERYRTAGVLPAPMCLSSNPDFDMIAAAPVIVDHKVIGIASREETLLALARIVLPDSAGKTPWSKFRRKCSPEVRAALERAIAASANPWEWAFTKEPIPSSKWLGVQVLRSGEWVNV